MAPKLQQRFINLGFTGELALEIAFTIGLLFMVGVVAGVYRLGVVGMHSVGRGHTTTELARRFVHSLVPIALAYVVAHYFSLLAYQGQAMAYLVSDPLGHGSDLFGTATATINYNVIGANGVWYVQVVALVLGHVCGLALAHDRALVVYQRVARRDPLAVLDAGGHGRLHEPRTVAALGRRAVTMAAQRDPAVAAAMAAMEKYTGAVPGYRRAHAHGHGFVGHFESTAAVAELTVAEHLQGDRVDAVVRLSNGAGSPYAAGPAVGPARGDPRAGHRVRSALRRARDVGRPRTWRRSRPARRRSSSR